ncbi:28S ribosomal protein S18c, mitochondrial [Geodia barretti]|uniref:28S ribosomal protein S18c, mitochondrial n=1 Tax=Geodia barretti TaxID=519541 RepID=A0AA35TDG3_GEOBA|nr:28S ribosomal protein S18c, mitochondrial [Geodia barretti]
MCSPLLVLQRPYCLTVLRRSCPSVHSHSRQQHTSGRTSLLDKKLPGVNDCPHNCLCSREVEFSYKNPRFLSQFVSSQTGMILPRNITKLCMKKQRRLASTIKRARHMGFMPYTHTQEEYLSDAKLY